MKVKRLFIAVAVLLVTAVPTESRADWKGLASPEFTYCHIVEPCSGGCEQWVLAPGTSCAKSCESIGEAPGFPCGVGGEVQMQSFLSWRVTGDERSYGGSPFHVLMIAQGERLGPSMFLVYGSSLIVGAADFEVAVFRYTGDPSLFDGLAPTSVFDLVDLGLIESRDVLLVESTPALDGSFEFMVDVSGLADEEIVLMATGAGSYPPEDVPASHALSAVGLVMILAALTTIVALKRRSA